MRHTILEAARVPLETARRSREVLDLAVRIAPIGNRNAISDAGVAAQLASAAVRGAVLNVRINLPYLPADEPLRHEAAHEASMLEAAAVQREDEVLSAVSLQLGEG
jgi:glutamate formiminotransferase/formiminotetrahydrofolate cyclodeaminase